jgi:Ca2+-binding RTX toxin-like protein
MHGLAGNDTLQGFGASDVLYGGGGHDLLDGGAGDDDMEGGTGDDTYIVDSFHDIVVEAPGAGYDQIRSSADTLLGNDGNDVLDGLGGADSLEGGAGDDTYFIDNAGDQVVEAPGGGRDLVYSALASTTLGANLEGLALLAGAVAGTGNGLDNDIAGNSGDNLLDGGGGADVINGLGGGIDTVTYAAFAGPVTVSLLAGTGFDGVSTDTLIGIENVIGTSLADTLVGDALGNVLDGGAGNDTITGGARWDVLIGGSGADLLEGDDGFDYASYETAAAGVVASLASQAVNTGDAQGDSYASIESLIGSSFADLLIGDAAANHLRGLAGNDTLEGLGALMGSTAAPASTRRATPASRTRRSSTSTPARSGRAAKATA